jgi:hypothetical protein
MACLFVLDGPAVKIFQRKLGLLEVLPLERAISKADAVLCGTGWQSDLEVSAIQVARLMGKRSVAFLDHWVNYRERFVRGASVILPDEIWVGDELAAEKAKAIFSDLPLRLVANPYFEDIRQEVAERSDVYPANSEGLRFLYVCEPIRDHGLQQFGDARYRGYVEEDALRYFLDRISVLAMRLKRPLGEIVIRLHPAEAPGKYAWVLQEFDLPIVESGPLSLMEEVLGCDVVVGCESMAMVVGLMAGKAVVSCIPPQGQACALPHHEILHMRALSGDIIS